jgi:hypothetical protein
MPSVISSLLLFSLPVDAPVQIFKQLDVTQFACAQLAETLRQPLSSFYSGTLTYLLEAF